ncbi:MAG: CAP-associated domain-containing protein [Dethiobacteria bacterium]
MNRSKKTIFIIILLLLGLFFIPGAPAGAAETKPGDVNGDGAVCVSDAILVLQDVVGIRSLSAGERERADLNGNGKVDVSDAIRILRIIVGLDGYSFRGVSMGDTEADVLRILGEPARKDLSKYGFEWYIYNQDYDNYIQMGIKEGRVVGIYTNAGRWKMNGGIRPGSTCEELKVQYGDPLDGIKKGNVNYLFSEAQKEQVFVCLIDEEYYAYFFLDKFNEGKVTAVQLIDKTVEEGMMTWYPIPSDALRTAFERQSMDLANAIRARNKKPPFQWCERARSAARKHSEDMALHNYFDHKNKQGEEPADRMTKEGILWSSCGENIAAGQTSAIMAHEGWMNSAGHRSIILGEGDNIPGDFSHVGVGVAFGGEHQIYYTQNFYTPQ